MVSDVLLASIERSLRAIVAEARACGVVVSVEQVSLEPKAMGHTRDVVTVRPNLAFWRRDQAKLDAQRPLSVKDYVLQMAPPIKKDEV